MNAELRRMSINDGVDIYDMLQEIPRDENGFVNRINGITLDDFKAWLIRSDDMSKGIGLESWMVPQTIFWLTIDGAPVGFGKLRHYLTDKLREEGGHIGYAIRPSRRGNGYGSLLLKLLLSEAKKLGIDSVLVTVHNDNKPSLQVALKNGGVIEKIDDIHHFIWITTS